MFVWILFRPEFVKTLCNIVGDAVWEESAAVMFARSSEDGATVNNSKQSGHIYMHISTHIYTYLHISSHIYTYLHISTHNYTYLHISTHIYTYLHISTLIYR